MTPPRAPVALFVYARPDHAEAAARRLLAADGADGRRFVVFADGPRTPDRAAAAEETRRRVRAVLGDRAEYVERDANRGLAASIEEGVGRLCAEHGRCVVVEDDLLVARSFLAYMDAALDRFADEPRAMQVSGYMYPTARFGPARGALFLPLTVSWGWGTWERAWKAYDPTAAGAERLETDRSLRRAFDIDGSFRYSAMMRAQREGRSDSWAIRFYWSVFRAGGLGLFPPRSLVGNIGFDGTGTHGWRSGRAYAVALDDDAPPPALPDAAEALPADRRELSRALAALSRRARIEGALAVAARAAGRFGLR